MRALSDGLGISVEEVGLPVQSRRTAPFESLVILAIRAAMGTAP